MSISELFRAIGPVTEPSVSNVSEAGNFLDTNFKNVFSEELKLSQHAESRIRSRQLKWDGEMQERIKNGIEKAEQKGSREVLILADSLAVIANIRTKTIITAMDPNALKDKVFTNIDGTVLV